MCIRDRAGDGADCKLQLVGEKFAKIKVVNDLNNTMAEHSACHNSKHSPAVGRMETPEEKTLSLIHI